MIKQSSLRFWLRKWDLNPRSPAYETGEDVRTPLFRSSNSNCVACDSRWVCPALLTDQVACD